MAFVPVPVVAPVTTPTVPVGAPKEAVLTSRNTDSEPNKLLRSQEMGAEEKKRKYLQKDPLTYFQSTLMTLQI